MLISPAVKQPCSHQVRITQFQLLAAMKTTEGHIYIDYNNDGDFEDQGELVFDSTNSTGEHTGSFTTASNPTQNAMLRMRVITSLNDLSDSCNQANQSYPGQTDYGQAEDYGVVFPGNFATFSVSQPSAAIAGPDSVAYTVTYSDADTITLSASDISLQTTGAKTMALLPESASAAFLLAELRMRCTVPLDTPMRCPASSWVRPSRSQSFIASTSSRYISICSRTPMGMPVGLKARPLSRHPQRRIFLGLGDMVHPVMSICTQHRRTEPLCPGGCRGQS